MKPMECAVRVDVAARRFWSRVSAVLAEWPRPVDRELGDALTEVDSRCGDVSQSPIGTQSICSRPHGHKGVHSSDGMNWWQRVSLNEQAEHIQLIADGEQSVFRSAGQKYQYGPRPRIATARPQASAPLPPGAAGSSAPVDNPPAGAEHSHSCVCFWTPESSWTRYGSTVEPGSQMEPNPDCPVHFPHPHGSEFSATVLMHAAANQLEAWTHSLDDGFRLDYLDELIPELRDRAVHLQSVPADLLGSQRDRPGRSEHTNQPPAGQPNLITDLYSATAAVDAWCDGVQPHTGNTLLRLRALADRLLAAAIQLDQK